jgi:hypothetical protein
LGRDLGKYVITAMVSFVTSFLYTEYRLGPEHNVSLVPLVMEKQDACEVDGGKLKEVLQQLPTDPKPDPKEVLQQLPMDPKPDPKEEPQKNYTYRSYLEALEQQRPMDKTRQVIDKRLILEEHFLRLQDDQVLKCEDRDPVGKSDLRYFTFLTVQVAVFLNEPFAYVLKRSCSLGYLKEEIPLRASLEEISPTSLGKIEVEPEILVIEKTRPLILTYDMRGADNIRRAAFDDLLKKMAEGKVDVTIKCTVVQTKGEKPIGGGQPYTVSVRTLL